MEGIFIAHGPDFKDEFKIYNVDVTDIAPTILHIFEISIPNEVDGKILYDIFKYIFNINKIIQLLSHNWRTK